MEEQTQAPAEPTPSQPQTQQPLTPHRGVLILILGILSIFCCLICGIVAWIMGNNDLRQMTAGTMDPSGRGLTNVGKICGIVGIAIQIVGIVLVVIGLILFFLVSAPTLVVQ